MQQLHSRRKAAKEERNQEYSPRRAQRARSVENGIFNLRKSADLLFSVDSVISVAKSSFSWFWCLSWFTLFSVFTVRFASRYRLSVAFGSKVVDRTLIQPRNTRTTRNGDYVSYLAKSSSFVVLVSFVVKPSSLCSLCALLRAIA